MRSDTTVHIHSESVQPMKISGFCCKWSNRITATVSSLPLLRTCSFRGPLSLDKLAAKPPAPQGYRPRTRSKPNMSVSDMIGLLMLYTKFSSPDLERVDSCW